MGQRPGVGPLICPRCGGTGEVHDKSAGVGDIIAAYRQRLNLTQEDLSKRVGKSRSQIANIEAGRSDLPISTLKKFAEAFGVSVKDLVP